MVARVLRKRANDRVNRAIRRAVSATLATMSSASDHEIETVLRLEVRGRVQGVGYRWSMVEEARRLGIRGWVRNRRDGSVEAMVAGPPEALEQIVAWARRGPRSAVVVAVDVLAGDGSFASFDPLPTA